MARKFGYEVSPGRAIDTSGGRSYVERLRRSGPQARRWARTANAAVIVLVAAAVLAFLARDLLGQTGIVSTVVFLGGLPIPVLAVVPKTRKLAARTEEWTVALVETLQEHPWQVRPVRVEEISPEEESAARAVLPLDRQAILESQGGPRRVLLLAPDGSVARSYVALVPADVWRGMTDGVGALWVCGDLRFRVALAESGAQRCWPGSPVPPPVRHRAQDEDSSVISAIAREAGHSAVLDWLG
ncbi:hypothetical protein [Embleya sp. NPDC059259]|uniref:hypothetical protein n=1 Tax=unclassified Embleya TaxID=2699296 RepID=UPI003690EB62